MKELRDIFNVNYDPITPNLGVDFSKYLPKKRHSDLWDKLLKRTEKWLPESCKK